MRGSRFLNRVMKMLGKQRAASKKRLAPSRRRILFETLESRRVFATDLQIFSVEIENGDLNTADLDANRRATVERVAAFVGSQLDIDLTTIAEASLMGRMADASAVKASVFTFEMDGMEWDFREGRNGLEVIDDDSDLFQNEELPMDTNRNGTVEPLDALAVINYINSSPTMLVPSRVAPEKSSMLVDVTGDKMVSPLDALIVINQLNSRSGTGSDDTSMPLIAEADYYETSVPADATEFPTSEIDVLANDFGEGLRIVGVEPALFGTVEIVESSNGSGKSVIRFTPGEQFRTFDTFVYTVEDSNGNQASAPVRIAYSVESNSTDTFTVIAAESVEGASAGAAIKFSDASGNGLISIDFSGDERATVGVLLNFDPNEAPFGLPVAGTFLSDTTLQGRFFPQLNGAAWITGTVAEVNEILAGIRYEPAPGFSAPDGINLSVKGFLYGSLGVSTQFSSDSIRVVVPTLTGAPLTVGNLFEVNRSSEPIRLNVLANDSSPSGSTLRLVGVAQYPDENEPSITTPFGSTIEIDPETNEVIYTAGFGSYESFVYIVSDAEGRLSQGKIAVRLIG